MKKSDKEFILELVRKETAVLSIALETKITENLKRELNQFRIHLQFRINQKLMRITNKTMNYNKFGFSMKHLAKCIKKQLKHHLIYDDIKFNF